MLTSCAVVACINPTSCAHAAYHCWVQAVRGACGTCEHVHANGRQPTTCHRPDAQGSGKTPPNWASAITPTAFNPPRLLHHPSASSPWALWPSPRSPCTLCALLGSAPCHATALSFIPTRCTAHCSCQCGEAAAVGAEHRASLCCTPLDQVRPGSRWYHHPPCT